MKIYHLTILLAFFLLSVACKNNQTETAAAADEHANHQAAPQETTAAKKPLSPRTSTMANIGDTHVHIDYSSPGVRDRTIWGGLVAYDQVWVTGAHKATSINFDQDVVINGTKIPAGTYGFFTIPGKEEWTLIINKNHEQHLADDYDSALDMVRIKAIPETTSEKVEALTYKVEATKGKMGLISVAWDHLKVSFEVEAS
jgi:hypothetical protein